MQNLGEDRNNQEQAEDFNSFAVKFCGKTQPIMSGGSLELFQAGARNSGSGSRVTARTFASTDYSTITNSHSLNLIGMNISTVVSTGSLSGEGMNFFSGAAVNDIHSESGINFLNLVPSNGVTLQRVDDDQTFIKKDYLGMDKNEIKNCADHQTPGDGSKSISESVIRNVYVNQGANRKVSAKSHNNSTAWPKALSISKSVVHRVILSRQESRAA